MQRVQSRLNLPLGSAMCVMCWQINNGDTHQQGSILTSPLPLCTPLPELPVLYAPPCTSPPPRELRRYGSPEEEDPSWQCNGTVAHHAMGHCAMAISSNQHFKYAQFYAGGVFKGLVGTAPLPGSSVVLDRGSGE